MRIPLGVTILALSTADMVQSFPTASFPIIDASAPQVLDLATRSASTNIDLYNSNSALEARQVRWLDYGILVCIESLEVLKYVVVLKGIQNVENICRLYATNKNSRKDAQIRVQKGNGPMETFTVKAATCSAQINLVDVFYGDQFKLQIQQQ